MQLIARNTRIGATPQRVHDAITTTAGYRGWWTNDCEVGRAAGEEAFRFDTAEVVFRIDRVDARGIEMICVRHKNFPDWQGTYLSIRAVEDGAGTHADLLHDGYPAKNGCYDTCVAGWDQYLVSLRAYCERGHGTPYVSRAKKTAAPSAG